MTDYLEIKFLEHYDWKVKKPLIRRKKGEILKMK